ncbi:hypothetical protein T552_03301 [Pneumocystis carinii B80]|uniref:Uncharacterized protein n=1 Tax=Pneumocystis carinii (strain B80) TaxID=1408658 RepID=A0A0W4ZC92_PNEC8|nr:hypothetical protein T552_03301 [Pneumocystis carinii B80]KTW26032.1 hypothetical protein T552_03301 [Pneumocystis carinii B80]
MFVLFPRIIHSILIKKIFYRLKRFFSKPTIRAISFLFFSSLVFLILELFFFLPENIILKTSSEIQTSEITLIARLARLRRITEYDQKLLSRLKTLDGRLLYILYGPSTLSLCEWCEIETPLTFLYYTIPHVFLYYILNLGIIYLSISILSEKNRKLLRKLIFIILFVFFIMELIMLNIYDWKSNAYINSALDIDWIHWNLKKYRLFLMIILNLSVAFIIWVININTLYQTPNKEKQLIFSINNLEESINRIRALVIMKRALIKDAFLQEQKMKFYQEKRLSQLNNPNIKDIKKKISHDNMKKIMEEVESYAESLIKYMDMEK